MELVKFLEKIQKLHAQIKVVTMKMILCRTMSKNKVWKNNENLRFYGQNELFFWHLQFRNHLPCSLVPHLNYKVVALQRTSITLALSFFTCWFLEFWLASSSSSYWSPIVSSCCTFFMLDYLILVEMTTVGGILCIFPALFVGHGLSWQLQCTSSWLHR
jgi:hypothetical protein